MLTGCAFITQIPLFQTPTAVSSLTHTCSAASRQLVCCIVAVDVLLFEQDTEDIISCICMYTIYTFVQYAHCCLEQQEQEHSCQVLEQEQEHSCQAVVHVPCVLAGIFAQGNSPSDSFCVEWQ
jgi:hypothetical protein